MKPTDALRCTLQCLHCLTADVVVSRSDLRLRHGNTLWAKRDAVELLSPRQQRCITPQAHIAQDAPHSFLGGDRLAEGGVESLQNARANGDFI